MSTKNLALLVDPLVGGRQRLKSQLATFYKVQEFSNNEAVMSKAHRMNPHLLVLVIRAMHPEPWGIVRYIRGHSRLSHPLFGGSAGSAPLGKGLGGRCGSHSADRIFKILVPVGLPTLGESFAHGVQVCLSEIPLR